MNKLLWQELLKENIMLDDLWDYEFIKSKEGSPYLEVEEINEKNIEVNPYFHLADIIPALAEYDNYFDTSEGRIIFDWIIRTLCNINLIKTFTLEQYKKYIIQKEILGECFGKNITQKFVNIDPDSQSILIDGIYKLYSGRQNIQVFFSTILSLLPGCLIFQRKGSKEEIYIYVGQECQIDSENKIELAKILLLPIGYKIYTAWETPFLIMDVADSLAEKNKII